MENKHNKAVTIFLIVVIVLLIAGLGVMTYFLINLNNKTNTQEEVLNATNKQNAVEQNMGNVNTNTNSSKEQSDVQNNTSKSSTAMTIEETKTIAQDLYSKVYGLISEGTGLHDGNAKKISANGKEVEAYKLDFSKVESYFTDSAMRNLRRYSDYMNGEAYYRTLNNTFSSTNVLDFMYTIFGVTDQGVRNLEIKSFNDNIIVAKSIKEGKMFEKYIIFVKENDSWKIDMFE